MRRGRRVAGTALGAVVLVTAACELQEITLVQADDVVVAEAYVELGFAPTPDRATAFLHRTLAGGTGASRPVPGAKVVITRRDGYSLEMAETDIGTCVRSTPVDDTGTCYWAASGVTYRILPGDTLDLQITLADGGVLGGTTVIPGDFTLLTPAPGTYNVFPPRCHQPPSTPLELRWTRSAGAWAYVNETFLSGLRDALEPKGIPVENDPLYLLGVSVSAQDTTIVFPGEFGVFDRFDLDQALAVELQRGLPAGANGRVTITAADRNYVNWIRGGNFNPSGQVRIPSLRGDGTGVFGSSVTRALYVSTDSTGAEAGAPPCAG
jgi:hypothetical protein